MAARFCSRRGEKQGTPRSGFSTIFAMTDNHHFCTITPLPQLFSDDLVRYFVKDFCSHPVVKYIYIIYTPLCRVYVAGE